MPIYEYQCSECGQRMEKLQKHSDPPLTDCPACGKAALKKLISPAAFRLKGSGWYETDFKTGSKRNLIGDPSGPPPSSGDSAGSGSTSTGGDEPAASKKTGTDDRTESGSSSKDAGGASKNAGGASKASDS